MEGPLLSTVFSFVAFEFRILYPFKKQVVYKNRLYHLLDFQYFLSTHYVKSDPKPMNPHGTLCLFISLRHSALLPGAGITVGLALYQALWGRDMRRRWTRWGINIGKQLTTPGRRKESSHRGQPQCWGGYGTQNGGCQGLWGSRNGELVLMGTEFVLLDENSSVDGRW